MGGCSNTESEYRVSFVRRARDLRVRRAAMESFVQLRRGTTPDRIHADVGELKDDEMGRNGFIGRQAQFYRRNDPTAFRSRGPIRDLHVPTYDVKPTDLTDA